jgi:amino acid transporter
MTEHNEKSAVTPANAPETGELSRSISLPMLVFYGLGTMIGGGIYALTGEVAGIAGMQAPLAFALAAVLALLTAFSYAELSSRHPVSAGEVRYVERAFNLPWLSRGMGWLVVVIGITSSAALTNATAGFLQDFLDLPRQPLSAALILVLGAVAVWGIRESVWLVTLITAIEVGGLILVIAATSGSFADLPARLPEILGTGAAPAVWAGVMSGAFLAFYAFIGFEDMVNVAEETKNAPATLPAAILICIAGVCVLYILVSLAAVLTMAPADLAAERTPLAALVRGTPWLPAWVLGVISLLATVNGVMVQLVMASRVLYGMARDGLAPGPLGRVSPRTHTPVAATLWATGAVLALALLFPVAVLAKFTSAVILVIFVAVNAALIRLKRRDPAPAGVYRVAIWIPWMGLISAAVMLALECRRLVLN